MANFRLVKSQIKEVVEAVDVEDRLDESRKYYVDLTKKEFIKHNQCDGRLKIERILFLPANLPKYHIERNNGSMTLKMELKSFRNVLLLESGIFTTDDNLLDSNFSIKVNGQVACSSQCVNDETEVTISQKEYETELLSICMVAFCVKHNLLK